MLRRLLYLTLLLCVSPIANAQTADKKMTFIEYVLVAYEIAPESFEAQPKRVWRVEDSHLRFEEILNPANAEQKLVIVAQPDIWLINAAAKKGIHTTDPGPTYKVNFPVLTANDVPELALLEMGREKEFFAARKPKSSPEKLVAGIACTAQEITVNKRKLVLYSKKSDGKPFQVALELGERNVAVRYLKYETGLAADAALFKPPADVAIEEGAQRKPASEPDKK